MTKNGENCLESYKTSRPGHWRLGKKHNMHELGLCKMVKDKPRYISFIANQKLALVMNN